jgi:hypothetical protein
MNEFLSDGNRRNFLGKMLSGIAVIVSSALFPVIQKVFAMGDKEYPQGMREIQGDVRINGKPAAAGHIVKPGDTVTTGADSSATFVIGNSAYLIRENSSLAVGGEKGDTENILRILSGKMLSVFGSGKKTVHTPTAVMGVRGTGLYVEADPTRTYLCLCYGVVDIKCRISGEEETLKATYHESPRYIYASGAISGLINIAPMLNHTDAELISLETLVGRKPPFVKNGISKRGGNY